MGGAGAVAGSGGFGKGGGVGKGGSSGGPDRGRIKEGCDAFCGPYAMTCPNEVGSQGQCTESCMADFGDAPRECHDVTIESLHCLAGNFIPELGCSECLFTAVNACLPLIEEAQACTDYGRPTPPPPVCPSSVYTSDVDCTTTMTCPEASYYVSCYRLDVDQTACNCSDDFGGATSFIADTPLSSACGFAMALCGYPYQ